MKAIVRQIQGASLAGRADSNHWVNMDTAPDFGGQKAASSPMELVLMGLGGCTSIDVLSILQKKRVKLDDYELHLEAERADDHPRVFTAIHLKFVFYGKDIPSEAVQRAIELSETKYCSATAMLGKTAKITTEFEIVESKD